MSRESSTYIARHHTYNESGSWRPWHELLFRTHSRKIEELAEIHRPDLQVTDIGAGKLPYYARRLEKVARRGGHYTVVEIDPAFIDTATLTLTESRDKQLIIDSTLIVESANHLLIDYISPRSQDVVIMNSLHANATLKDVAQMGLDLSQLQNPSEDVVKGLSYLEKFLKQQLHDSDILDYPIQGVKANILAFINAFLLLKPGGKFVYAQNDRSMMAMDTYHVGTICERIGFSDTRMFYPGYNWLSSNRTTMGMMTAVK